MSLIAHSSKLQKTLNRLRQSRSQKLSSPMRKTKNPVLVETQTEQQNSPMLKQDSRRVNSRPQPVYTGGLYNFQNQYGSMRQSPPRQSPGRRASGNLYVSKYLSQAQSGGYGMYRSNYQPQKSPQKSPTLSQYSQYQQQAPLQQSQYLSPDRLSRQYYKSIGTMDLVDYVQESIRNSPSRIAQNRKSSYSQRKSSLSSPLSTKSRRLQEMQMNRLLLESQTNNSLNEIKIRKSQRQSQQRIANYEQEAQLDNVEMVQSKTFVENGKQAQTTTTSQPLTELQRLRQRNAQLQDQIERQKNAYESEIHQLKSNLLNAQQDLQNALQEMNFYQQQQQPNQAPPQQVEILDEDFQQKRLLYVQEIDSMKKDLVFKDLEIVTLQNEVNDLKESLTQEGNQLQENSGVQVSCE